MTHQMQNEPNQAQYINPLMHSLPPIVPSFLPGSDPACTLDNACGDSWDPEKQVLVYICYYKINITYIITIYFF